MSAAPRRRPGRALVYAVFSIVVAYFAVALVGSIVTEIYGGPPPDHLGSGTRAERTWCIREVVDLRDEIEGKVTLELQHGSRDADPFARWRTFESAWLARMDAARTRCAAADNAALDEAFGNLTALHGGYVAGVDQMITTRTTAARKLADSLSVLKKQPH